MHGQPLYGLSAFSERFKVVSFFWVSALAVTFGCYISCVLLTTLYNSD